MTSCRRSDEHWTSTNPLSSRCRWIHIDDLVHLILFVIDNAQTRESLNATSPEPVTNKEFSKALGSVLGRPVLLSIPTFVLSLQVGEGAAALASSQRALPARVQELGFSFQHPNINEALASLLRPRR
jgi:NAD dependent epimerase/dehydratase family enzyme